MKKLGFGLMRLPLTDTDKENRESIDQRLVNEMADCFLENGFTYFDTAYPYHQGMSERAAKSAIVERYPRDSFTLADKIPTWMIKSSEDYQTIFNEQLSRCGVDYFDYYMLHGLGEQSYASSLQHGGFEFMNTLKSEGKARHIGFSFHDKAKLLDRILTEHPEVEFVQLQINYLDWEDDAIESRKCYETAATHGKPVIVMEPVKGGSLATVPEEAHRLFKGYSREMSVASWAVRFAASLDDVSIVLSGMSDYEQLADNVGYMRDFSPLNDDERRIISQATEVLKKRAAIPCTACQYCVDDCPQNIPIPKFFSLYNDQKSYNLVPAHANYYRSLILEYGKASDCIACKKCERRCPQHIDISEKMKEVSMVFDGYDPF
jgi:predicted aldo/keto reductase-like oxidoreductase